MRNITIALGLGAAFCSMPTLALGQEVAVTRSTVVPSEIRQGYVLLGKGWVNDAIAVFQSAIRRYPDSVEARLGLAISYRRAGQDQNAWNAYQQVLSRDPNNALALKTVGMMGVFRPQWQTRGIEALTAYLSQMPNDVEARSQRALLLGYQGRFAESLADYDQVLRGNVSPATLLNAAQTYTYAGDEKRAVELFEQYRSRSGSAISGNAAIAYARALRGTGNTAEAIRVLEVQPDSVQLRSELSQAYLDNQQPTQAIAVLETLRDRSDARLPLARALNEVGKRTNRTEFLSQSAELYLQVLNQSQNPPASLVRETADVLSGIPQERQTALQLYRQLVTQDPSNKPLIVQQLALEKQLGTLSPREIRQRLQPILQPLPTDSAQRFAIARSLVQMEPDPEFLPVYQELVRSNVNEPFLQFRLAQLLIERNEIDAAKVAIEQYQSTPAGKRDRSPELLLAEIDRRQGNLNGAAQRYEALVAEPSEVQNGAIRGLAGIRIAQFRYAEALTLYDQLLARSPNDPQLQLGRTAIAYQARMITESQADVVLDRYLAARPADSPEELYTLVGVLPARGKREPLYTELLEADPKNVPIQVKLIQVLADRDPRAARVKANQLIAKARQTSPGENNPSLLLLRGRLEQTLGNLDRAEEAYQAILKLQPENLDALTSLGGVNFQQRDFESASRQYDQALELNPENVGVRRSIAELSAVQGLSFAAMEQLERLRIEQQSQGAVDVELDQRIQKLQEDMLRQRGFQPSWERY
ncbi:tetratricopeptide repeat protein [Pseudanabaenaceae cyanobacterium LEGE 13415]|nr:tetratricopeptide repeat protein [Pseudanabaenaceae cyanobacterium LEGE 13415]